MHAEGQEKIISITSGAVLRFFPLLQTALDSISLPICYIDAELRYRMVNRAFAEAMGLKAEQIVSRAVVEVVGLSVFEQAKPYLAQALNGEVTGFDREIELAQGERRWIHTAYYPYRDSLQGNVSGLIAVYTNIQHLKNLESAAREREHELRLFLDSIPEPVAYIHPTRRYLFVNLAFANLRGLPREQIFGRTSSEVLGTELTKETQDYVDRVVSGERVTYQRLDRNAKGVERWLHVLLVPDLDEQGFCKAFYSITHDITDVKRAQDALREREAELQAMMNAIPSHAAYVHADLTYGMANRAFEHWSGYSQEQLRNMRVPDVIGDERYAVAKPYIDRVLAGEATVIERELTLAEGRKQWLRIHYTPDFDTRGRIRGYYAVGTDIHGLKTAEQKLRHANWMLSSHLENTPLAVIEWNSEFQLIRWSPQAEKIFGWRQEEVLGRRLRGWNFIFEDDWPAVNLAMDRLLSAQDRHYVTVHRNYRKDGRVVWIEWYHSCLFDETGQLLTVLSFAQDVTRRVQAEERLHYLASHDVLTGLPNRTLLQEQLEQALSRARLNRERLCIVFIDLDGFKQVNDCYGHRIGDELLQMLAHKVQTILEPHNLFARLGGDEFLIVQEHITDKESAGRLAAKLLDLIREPHELNGQEISISASVGISFFPDDGEDFDHLLKNADTAMYRAKDGGKSTFEFFSADRERERERQQWLKRQLRQAIEKQELLLYYQPVIELPTGRVMGAEVLLRWDSKELGMVLPNDFVPLAEESDLIFALDQWVVGQALLQVEQWRQTGLILSTLGINISARQLHRRECIARLSQLVRGYDPTQIQIEVTETSLLSDLPVVSQSLSELRKLGLRIAIDDFGTGYSSLSHLKQLPIDALKIDTCFIADLMIDPGDAAITRAIIDLTHGLQLKAIAEGIESQAQLQFLIECGCQFGQGYYFSRPLPATQFVEYMKAAQRRL